MVQIDNESKLKQINIPTLKRLIKNISISRKRIRKSGSNLDAHDELRIGLDGTDGQGSEMNHFANF